MKKTIKSINPYSEELNAEFDILNKEEIDEKIALAQSAFLKWRELKNSEKKKLFLNLADVIEKNIEELAKLQTIEM